MGPEGEILSSREQSQGPNTDSYIHPLSSFPSWVSKVSSILDISPQFLLPPKPQSKGPLPILILQTRYYPNCPLNVQLRLAQDIEENTEGFKQLRKRGWDRNMRPDHPACRILEPVVFSSWPITLALQLQACGGCHLGTHHPRAHFKTFQQLREETPESKYRRDTMLPSVLMSPMRPLLGTETQVITFFRGQAAPNWQGEA